MGRDKSPEFEEGHRPARIAIVLAEDRVDNADINAHQRCLTFVTVWRHLGT